MTEQKRAFKGVWIPAEIWLSENLTISEKIILTEISSFCNAYQSCYASNEHFAKLLQVGERRIQTIIKSLETKGLIEREIIYKQGTKEVDKRFLKVRNRWCPNGHDPHVQMVTTPHDRMNTTPHDQKVADNNTVYNNTVCNNTENDIGHADGLTDEMSDLIKFCNDNVEILTPFKMQMLEGYVDDYGIEWVQRGLEKVAGMDRTKQNVKYLGGVLKGWKKDGVTKPWESNEGKQESKIMHDDVGEYELIDGYKVYL